MLTSQFSSVLQYSTNDSADAMRQLGWDVRVCTETRAVAHDVAARGRAAIAGSSRTRLPDRPPALRDGDAIPPKLPFICWIQDHLTNLASAVAGASVGERDFVLTGGVYEYVERTATRVAVHRHGEGLATRPRARDVGRGRGRHALRQPLVTAPESIVTETCAAPRRTRRRRREARMHELLPQR